MTIFNIQSKIVEISIIIILIFISILIKFNFSGPIYFGYTEAEIEFKKICQETLLEYKNKLPLNNFPAQFNVPDLDNCIIKNEKCLKYLFNIRTFLETHPIIQIRYINNSKLNGKVNKNEPTTLYMSTILASNIAEIRRTMIHELAHLTDWNLSQHGVTYNCSYFQSMSLVCEFCITGEATLIFNYSKSQMNLNKITCYIKN